MKIRMGLIGAMLVAVMLSSVLVAVAAHHGDGDGDKAGRKKHKRGHFDPAAHLREADANEDGKVTYEEYKAASEKRLKARFDRMDKNADGAITEDEFPQMKKKKRKKDGDQG